MRRQSVQALLALVLLAPLPLLANGFVTTQGTTFQVDGQPFHYVGTNCYYLMTWAADPGLRAEVDEVLLDAHAMGLRVIRTWAFNDGNGWNALQTAPRTYSESTFQGLDYVLARCDSLGLRVVLPLVNNWTDYGGMDQYVAWSSSATMHDDFFTDDSCRAWYRNHANELVNRVNVFNGRRYGDDPTILAWELANEARCPSDPSGDTLVEWIDTMSAHIQSIDGNHLVTTGIEGFFDDNAGPWYLNGSQGVDFRRNHQVAHVDYATAHSWPDHWGFGLSTTMSLFSRQLHEAHTLIGKPFVLEEFGKARDGAVARARVHYDPATWAGTELQRVGATYGGGVPGARSRRPDEPLAAATRRPGARPAMPASAPSMTTTTRDLFFTAYCDSLVQYGAAGSHFWILYHDTYPDFDGFGVYYPADSNTIAVLDDHVQGMASWNVPTDVVLPGNTAGLGAPWPNPFRGGRAGVSLRLAASASPVTVQVYDTRGRRLRTLLQQPAVAADHTVLWDGRDAHGRLLPPGVYFLQWRNGVRTTSRRVVLLR